MGVLGSGEGSALAGLSRIGEGGGGDRLQSQALGKESLAYARKASDRAETLASRFQLALTVRLAFWFCVSSLYHHDDRLYICIDSLVA